MSTAISIKSKKDKSVCLFVDRQVTYYDQDDEILSKIPTEKIINGEFWAFCTIGQVFSEEFERFCDELKNPKEDRDSIYGFGNNDLKVKRYFGRLLRSFPQSSVSFRSKLIRMKGIDTLNSKFLARGGDLDDALALLWVVNHPRVETFYVDSFGNLRNWVEEEDERDNPYLVAGSGAEEARKYIEKEMLKRGFGNSIRTPDAIELGKNALTEASKSDIGTSGLDLIIADENNMKHWGKYINKELEKRSDELFEEIKKAYAK